MRRLFRAGLTFAILAGPLAADSPKPLTPDAAVALLGAGGFAEREAAAQSLRDLGESALAALEKAANDSPDAEVRSRAGRLVAEIKVRVESAKLIAPKTLTLDFTNAPLATVINELRQKTGLPVSLDPNGVKDPLRPVTVKSAGPVPMWEAVELVCEAARLREQFRPEIPVTSSRSSGRRTWDDDFGQVPSVNPNAVPVLLADGQPHRLPGGRDTAVRVLALPPAFPGSRVVRGSGEAILMLDVTPSPGVNWGDVIAIHVRHAIDETGRPVSASRLMEQAGGAANGNVMWVGGGMVVINNYYSGNQRPAAMPNPRVVPLTLRTDDRAITKLTVLEGTLLAEAMIRDAEVLRHENLAAVVRAPADAGSGQRLTITDYAPQPDGTTKVKVKVESVPVANRRRGLMPMNAFNNVAFAVQMNGGGDGSNLINNHTYLDDAGKPVAKPKAGPVQMVESNVGYAQEVELTFAKGQTPAKLSVKGTKAVLLEVPFQMANVPLP
jgi:hypothetical protein